MRINRLCKVCGKPFTAIKTNQFFCNRKCFKKDYYVKSKIRLQDELGNQKFPSKHCDFCNTTTQLDFDPIKEPDLVTSWQCPKCNVNNKILWKYEDCHNSREVIMDFLIKHKEKQVYKIEKPKYQIYHIPVSRPEQCDSTILTMACDVVSVMSIRKMNRKKIIFS